MLPKVGLVLSGVEDESLELLQRYLDVSGDVQTAAWLAVRGLRPELARRPGPQEWFACYSGLLDSWRMWTPRAEFDIEMGRAGAHVAPPLQVYLSCNYCGLPTTPNVKKIPAPDEVRTNILREEAKTKQLKQTGQAPPRIAPNTCRGCEKPFPRCAICLLIVGNESGNFRNFLSFPSNTPSIFQAATSFPSPPL